MKILCATDLTSRSHAAEDRAGLLATQLDAELVLVHAVLHSATEAVLEQRLRESTARMKARTRAPLWRHEVAPNTMIRIGSPLQVISQAAEEIGADLVVLGPHEPVARERLAGTTAARLMSERRWPVLIARDSAHGAYRNVLLALDLNPESAAVIRAAESLVLQAATDASVVHSCQVPYSAMLDSAGLPQQTLADFPGMVTAQARDNILELLARESDGSIQYGVTVSRSSAAIAIDSAARELQADLIVMGTRGHGRVRRALLGSVANHVVESAMTDVLVVPEQKAASRARSQTVFELPGGDHANSLCHGSLAEERAGHRARGVIGQPVGS